MLNKESLYILKIFKSMQNINKQIYTQGIGGGAFAASSCAKEIKRPTQSKLF